MCYLLVHRKSPHLRHDKNRRFWFDVSEVSVEESLMDAEMRVFRDLSQSTLPSNLTYHLILYTLSQQEDPQSVYNYIRPVNRIEIFRSNPRNSLIGSESYVQIKYL